MKLSIEAKKYIKNKKLLFAARACENKNYSSMINWYDPLREIFSNILVFDPQKQSYIEGQEKMNYHFLTILKKEKPDFLIIWQHPDDFYIDTLLKIKELSPKTKIINFIGDDDGMFEYLSRCFYLFADFTLIFQFEYLSKYLQERVKNVFFNSCLNSSLFKPLNLPQKYDVTFIGTPKADRYKIIKFLKDNKINIKIFGSGWERYPDLADIYEGHPDNNGMITIPNQTKISLYFSKNNFGRVHLKGRIFEVGACKSFALVERYDFLGRLFKEGREIIFFKDKKDLLKKIKYYLSHEVEREKIASAMHKKIELRYNLYSELAEVFKEVYKQRNQPPKQLPKMDNKVLILNEDDIIKDKNFISNKVKDYDYVAFQKGETINFLYKNYIQMHFIKVSKKPISCAGYYAFSDRIRDYLLMIPIRCFINVSMKDVHSILNINQFLVDKNYFLKNLFKFKKLYEGGDTSFITEENTSFIMIPLLRIKNIVLDSKLIGKTAFSKIDTNLSSAFYKNSFFDKFYFNLLFESLFMGKYFLLKDLFNRRFKNNLHVLGNLKRLINGTLYHDYDSLINSI
jgi:hypothetical protein